MVGAAPISVLEPSRTALAQLCLRLVTGPLSGRLVKLSAPRCTLGSGPGCTLRLKAAGVAPLHCVIERTATETMIRSLAAQIWLDGQPIGEARLVRGSRLKLGSIEFVLEDEGRLLAEQSAEKTESAAVPDVCPPLAETLESAQLRQDFELRLQQLDQTLDKLGRELVQHTEWRSDWQTGLSQRLQEELAQASPLWTTSIADTVTAVVASSVGNDLRRWLEGELTTRGGQLAADVTSHVCTLVTPQVSSAVAEQLGQSLAVQLTGQLERFTATRIEELAPRMQAEIAHQLAQDLATKLDTDLAQRLPSQASRAAAAALAPAAERITHELAAQLQADLKAQVTEEIDQRAPPLRQAITSEVQADLRNWLNGELAAAGERLTAQVTSHVHEAVAPKITEVLTANLSGSLEIQLNEKLSTRVHAEVTQATLSAVEQAVSKLAGELSAQLNGKLSADVAEVAGEIDRRQAAWHEAVVGNVKTEVAQQLTPTLADNVAHQLREQLAGIVPDLKGQVEDLSRKSLDEIQAQIVEEIGRQSALNHAVLSESLSAEAQRVLEQVTQQLEERLADLPATGQPDSLPQQWAGQIAEEITSHVEGLSSQLAREVTDRVRNQLNEQIAAQVTRQVAAEQAALEAQRAAWEQQQKKSQGELNLHAQNLEQRLEALTRFQRGLDEQHQQWQHDLQNLRPEVQAQAEQIQQHAMQWRKALEEAAVERDALRAELERWQVELSQESRQLAARLESLAAQWTTIEQQQWVRPPQAELVSDGRCEQMEHRLAEIRAEREAFEHERQQGVEDRNQPHPGERAHALNERLTELCPVGESPQRERQHLWQDDEDRGENPSPAGASFQMHPEASLESPTPSDDSSADDAWAAASSPGEHSLPPVEPSKLFAHLLRDDEADPEGEPARDAPHLASQVDQHAGGAAAHNEDESIENYMARLMDRVRIMQGEPLSPPATAVESASSPRRREGPATKAAPAAAPELPKVKDLSELVPRGTPAELTSNISAMRDLANLTARSAIDTHSRKRMRSKVWGKLFVAFVALTAAVALTWMSSAAGQLAYGAALVSTIVAVIWGLEYLILSGYHFWWRNKTDATRGTTPAASERAGE